MDNLGLPEGLCSSGQSPVLVVILSTSHLDLSGFGQNFCSSFSCLTKLSSVSYLMESKSHLGVLLKQAACQHPLNPSRQNYPCFWGQGSLLCLHPSHIWPCRRQHRGAFRGGLEDFCVP